MRTHPSMLFLLASIAGCASGPAMRRGPLDPGQASAQPSMECLPDPDVSDQALTERMRFGWRLAAESFLVPPPEAPHDATAHDIERWSDEVLAPWLRRKTHTIEAARHELDRAAEENHRQRIMGGAIVGLMYEDVARVLRSIPAPEELRDEPEIRDIYRDILTSQARPFLEEARHAYSACAQNAVQPRGMRHWSRFCATREENLPGSDLGSDVPNGETQVDVVVD